MRKALPLILFCFLSATPASAINVVTVETEPGNVVTVTSEAAATVVRTDYYSQGEVDALIAALAGGHDAVTIGTANGLSLSTQELSLAAATNATPGAATAAQITKLESIADGAEVNPDLISQAEAEAGVSETERMFSALRVKQAIEALGGGSSTDDQNISGSGLSGTTLTIGIEDGTSEDVDLSPLQDGYEANTDDQDLTLSGNTLAISGDPNTDVDISTATAVAANTAKDPFPGFDTLVNDYSFVAGTDYQGVLAEGAFENGDKTKLDNQSGTNTGDNATNTTYSDCGFNVVIGGTSITAGDEVSVSVPYGMTITEYTILADASGSIQVDVWNDTYANYPPTDADTITASAPIAISSAVKANDSTLTGWTTAITAEDVLTFYVDSVTTITKVTIMIKGTR